MSDILAQYIVARSEQLLCITETLKSDERFVAAWLTGSFGRGEQVDYSDIDIRVIVANAYSERLCARPWPHGVRITDARLALFSQFGKPLIIYEAPGNAPEGGTFTYVLYEHMAMNVDWILVPQALAKRAADTRLLFDKVGIPLALPEEPLPMEERIVTLSNTISFFWMIAASCIKYLHCHDSLYFNMLLDWLYRAVYEVTYLLEGKPIPYHKGAHACLASTQAEQITALRHICERMLELMPKAVEIGAAVPQAPMSAVETRLAMVAET
ncbi:MAG: nucleotidyltransferase domain-containing protein [Chloroflexota bacterium]|nr:nucleotidyltransferase domain-containing protein [Chloroflexota bacterium]